MHYLCYNLFEDLSWNAVLRGTGYVLGKLLERSDCADLIILCQTLGPAGSQTLSVQQ